MALATRSEVNDAVRERVADPQFRAALIADPRGTLSEVIGVRLCDEVSVTVHEESLTDVHLVFPAALAADGSLSDDDLATVSGAGFWWAAGCSYP